MSDTGNQKDISVDARDELLQIPSLWEFFIEKTVADARKWFSARISSPPWGIFIGLVAATIFFGFLKSLIAILSGLFAMLLLIWIVFIRSGNTQSGLDSVLVAINAGDFPFELRDSITKRLRWWSMLIVPAEWTKNSRVFLLRDKLLKRLEELDSEIMYWQSAEGVAALAEINESEEAIRFRYEEQQRKLNLLKSRGVNVSDLVTPDEIKKNNVSERYLDPVKLIKFLRGKGECNRQLERISKINDPIERAKEEKVLVQALLMHCGRVIEMIDEVENLQVNVDLIKSDNISDKVKEIIVTLEKRRGLVGKLNRIAPKKIIDIVDYDPAMAQSAISKGRMSNAKKQ